MIDHIMRVGAVPVGGFSMHSGKIPHLILNIRDRQIPHHIFLEHLAIRIQDNGFRA